MGRPVLMAVTGSDPGYQKDSMTQTQKKPSIVIFFPVYHDEATVETVAMKSIAVLEEVASEYRVIIVNDASPDRSGEIADELAAQHSEIISLHHEVNRGYGAAVRTGFEHALSLGYDWICFTDGDDQYDVNELYRISELFHHYDLLITFRYARIYGAVRILISHVYNVIVRALFRSPYRDHSSGLKAIRADVVRKLAITSNSPFVGAEIIIKTMVMGYPIGEVGIATYPRRFGESNSTSLPNIYASIKDMFRVYHEIFRQYEL
jgi:glycosyltransferase involved in cell wall biosynthesis